MQGIKINLDSSSVNRVKSEFNNLIKELQKSANVDINLNKINEQIKNIESTVKNSSKKLHIFDEAQLKEDNIKVYESIQEIKKNYESLGEVNFPSIFKDANGNVTSLVMQLKQADGIIKNIKFDKINLSGSGETLNNGFVVQNIKEIDKTAEITEKELQKIQEINQQILKNKEKEEQQNARLIEQEQQRIVKLGELKGSFGGELFSQSNQEIESYIKSLYDVDAKVVSFKRTLDGTGNSIIKATVNTRNNKNEIEQEKLVLDKNTASVYKNEESIKANTARMVGFIDRIKNAVQAFLSFSVVMGGFYGAIHKVEEAIQFTNDLNKAQTNIQMITGMNSQEIQKLTKDYSQLASQLHETTSGALEASEEFLRAGNNTKETADLIKASTVMSKISGQDQKESADQLIAIMNSYKMSSSEMMSVVDKLVMVDNSSATSTKELGQAIEKTASSAQMAGVTFSDLVSYIGTVSSISRKSADSIGES